MAEWENQNKQIKKKTFPLAFAGIFCSPIIVACEGF